jgi:hypothetical protein
MSELERFRCLFAHIIARVNIYIMRKVLALISSGCVRRAVSKQSWRSQFLDGF